MAIAQESMLGQPTGRRGFLKYSGGLLVAGAALQSCKKDKNDNPTPSGQTVNLGTGDTGVLNYAYALEQLEAAFYDKVVNLPNFTTIISNATEQAYLRDIAQHEKIHKDFFAAALGNAKIQNLTPKFSSIDFATRAGILGAAKTFEDTGIAAYNGAGYLISNPDYLVLAGKIVSVEARHAAWIREALMMNTFVTEDVVAISTNSLEKSKKPAAILLAIQPFIEQTLNGSGLV